MDHKDLLDSVISGMAEKGATKNVDIPEVEIDQDDAANAIQLSLSTGETYLVDPEGFDWNNAMQSLGQLSENETAFRNMMFGLINIAHEDSDEAKKHISKVINDLTEYLKGYQIQVDYKQFNDKLTDLEIAMLLLFDVNNVTRTMNHHISIYSMMTMLTPVIGGTNPFVDFGEPTEEMMNSTNENDKVYLVKADGTEGGITITSITETDDYSPDMVGVVDDSGSGTGSYEVIVYATDVKEARVKAEKLMGLHPQPLSGIDLYEAASSGLLEDNGGNY